MSEQKEMTMMKTDMEMQGMTEATKAMPEAAHPEDGKDASMAKSAIKERVSVEAWKQEATVSENEEPEKEKKKKKGLLLLLLLLLLIGLAVGGWKAWKYYTVKAPLIAKQKELDAEIGIMPGMTVDQIQDRLNRHVAEGRFNASMNGNPVFKNGKEKGNLRIENIPGNRYAFTVTLQIVNVDADEYPEAAKHIGETVLETGLLEPGSYVSEKQLDVNLPKGNYDCLATFTAYTSEKTAGDKPQKEVGATAMQLILTVQE